MLDYLAQAQEYADLDRPRMAAHYMDEARALAAYLIGQDPLQ